MIAPLNREVEVSEVASLIFKDVEGKMDNWLL